MSAPILYAFTLGLVAAVNPCGFPLLPAYLALFLGKPDLAEFRPRTVTALFAGGCVTLGFIVAFGGIGVLVQLGVLALAPWTTWLTVAVGIALIVIGSFGIAGRRVSPAIRAPRFAQGRSVAAMAGFGFAYALSSLSCALPLFLAAVSSSFGRYGFLDGVAIFLSYAIGMGVFVTGASVVAAHLGVTSLRLIRPVTRFVPVIAYCLLLLIGFYVAATSILTLADPLSTPTIVTDVDAVQNAVSQWLASDALIIGSVLLAIVLVAIGLLAYTANHAHQPEEEHA